MITLLLTGSQRTQAVRSETVSKILTRLTNYAQVHFKAEEKLLAEHVHPDLAAQK